MFVNIRSIHRCHKWERCCLWIVWRKALEMAFLWNFNHWLHRKLSIWVYVYIQYWKMLTYLDDIPYIYIYIYIYIMMTSSNGSIFRVTGHLCGISPVTGEFPTQRPVTRSFDVFFIFVWINSWVNNREAGDFRCYRTPYDVIVMEPGVVFFSFWYIYTMTANGCGVWHRRRKKLQCLEMT